jgi:hypothetical protein
MLGGNWVVLIAGSTALHYVLFALPTVTSRQMSGAISFTPQAQRAPRALDGRRARSSQEPQDRKSRKGDWQPRGAEINTAEPGTVARTCTLTPATGRSRVSVVKSQVEDYRAKAKEYARLTAVTKSLREGRRYRKLAEMYWALALGEEPENVQPSKMIVKTSPT